MNDQSKTNPDVSCTASTQSLRKILMEYINKIDTESISSDELILLNEFFIRDSVRDNITKEMNEETIGEKEMLKYAFLGYWLYRELGKK